MTGRERIAGIRAEIDAHRGPLSEADMRRIVFELSKAVNELEQDWAERIAGVEQRVQQANQLLAEIRAERADR